MVFPNPTNGNLSVLMPGMHLSATYQLYSSLGVLVHKGEIDRNMPLLDLSGFSKGLYLLKVKNKNGNNVCKILLQ